MTAKDLAERFEVSVRTIYRDIDVLSSAGIPIYASQGKGGGIALMEHFILNKSVLTEAEQNEILFALQSLTVTQNPETDMVLSKIKSIFNKNTSDWIEVDLSPWGSDKKQICEFTILKNSILNREIIEFEYYNADGEKGYRRVEPVKLLFKVNAWYLKGFCLTKKAERTFKISRMANLLNTGEGFTARPDKAEETSTESTQLWVKIQLKIASNSTYRIYEEFNEKDITKNQDGSFGISTLLPDNKWLISYLLSFGGDVLVLAPQHLRNRLREQSAKIFEHYS